MCTTEMDMGDSETDVNKGNPLALQLKLISPGISNLTSTPKKAHGNTIQARLLKEKQNNKSIALFCSTPTVKRTASQVVSPEAVGSPSKRSNVSELTSPSTIIITSSEVNLSAAEECCSSPETSPNSTLRQSEMADNNLSVPMGHHQPVPMLTDPEINPQLKNFLMVMLQENRAATAKILAKQDDTSERLTILENCVKKSNEDHSAAIQGVQLRVESVEVDLIQTKSNLENKILKLTSAACSCSQDHPDNSETVKKLEDRIEAQDRASRRNNLIFSGLAVPESEVKEAISKILTEKFGYSGPVMNIRTYRKATSKNPSTIGVTLDSFESKIDILRKKRNVADLGNIYIKADLTVNEKKQMAELKKFVDERQPDGEGVIYSYLRIMCQGEWYRWDETSQSVVSCGSFSKSMKSSRATQPSASLDVSSVPAQLSTKANKKNY